MDTTVSGGAEPFDLTGGELSLDFVNTLSGRKGGGVRERLVDYGSLLAWAQQTGSLSAEQVARLRTEARQRPTDAAGVVQRAWALREAVHGLHTAGLAGREMSPAELAVLNGELSLAQSALRLESGPSGLEWRWGGDEGDLSRVLWPVVRAAAVLLSGAELGRVRECASESCGWLFLDHSRNQSRRWCDMQSCGNRAKVRRHRQAHSHS